LNRAVKYWAFISYSHRDATIADWLHKKLETYRVPAGLVGVPSRDGTVPARLLPIFRDREELPTSSQLGDNLQKSLQQSHYLVVICSPAAAQSRWVEEEIRAFKGWQGRDRIIALIGSGIPNGSETADPATECFPHSLRFEGVGTDATPIRVEPIAADLRPEGDGRQRAFLKIVAGVLGVGFDDLYQREKRRGQRRRVLAGALGAMVLLILIGTFWWIARLGRSQEKIRQEMATVGAGSKLLTTEFKDIRLSNKEAEARLRAAHQQANAALDEVEEALRANKPDAELQLALQKAQKALLSIGEQARTTEEQIFVGELMKPVSTRLLAVSQAVSNEMVRRVEAEVERLTAKGYREAEERNKAQEAEQRKK
jgi:hypothetical protein